MTLYTAQEIADLTGVCPERVKLVMHREGRGKRLPEWPHRIVYTAKDLEWFRKRPRPGRPGTGQWYLDNPSQTPERRRARYLALKKRKKELDK